jgi:hypothetical protein
MESQSKAREREIINLTEKVQQSKNELARVQHRSKVTEGERLQ